MLGNVCRLGNGGEEGNAWARRATNRGTVSKLHG